MKSAAMARRAGIIVVLSLASIVFHEFGHYIVYRVGGIPVRITFQSVRPIGAVNPTLNNIALAMGPAFSLIGGVICLLIARRRPSFFWVTAAFTNATLRLFPLVFDMVRAIQKAGPFSDEGNIVLAFTANPARRAIILLAIFAIFLSLTVLVARCYSFPRYRTAKAFGIYLLSLGVGISLVLIDEMLK